MMMQSETQKTTLDDPKKPNIAMAVHGKQNKITELEEMSKSVTNIKNSPYAMPQMRTHRGPNCKRVAYD